MVNLGGELLGWGPNFIVASRGKNDIVLYNEKGVLYKHIFLGDKTFVRVVGDTFIVRQQLILIAYLITYDRFGKYVTQCVDTGYKI